MDEEFRWKWMFSLFILEMLNCFLSMKRRRAANAVVKPMADSVNIGLVAMYRLALRVVKRHSEGSSSGSSSGSGGSWI